MSPEIAIKVLVVAAVVVLALLVLMRYQAPRVRTQRLAMTVWSAYGPYDSAESAADCLRFATRAVFGKEGAAIHEKWVEGHIENFRTWQADGSFQRMQKIMRAGLQLTAYGPAFKAACQQFREETVAQATEAAEQLNKGFLKDWGHKIEAVKQRDGLTKFVYKDILSDEEIERKERELGESVFNAIGQNLLEGQSTEAKQLLAFLSQVHQANMGKDLETPKDVGIIWFACLQVLAKKPDSQVAQTFKVLNDAWTATKSDKKV